MKWQEIQEQYPHRWVVVEAIGAYTDGAHRVIEELALVGTFGSDFREAWEFYKHIHAQDKEREYYYLHTDREALNIGVMDAFRRVITE